jgi:hypothetical protein
MNRHGEPRRTMISGKSPAEELYRGALERAFRHVVSVHPVGYSTTGILSVNSPCSTMPAGLHGARSFRTAE